VSNYDSLRIGRRPKDKNTRRRHLKDVYTQEPITIARKKILSTTHICFQTFVIVREWVTHFRNPSPPPPPRKWGSLLFRHVKRELKWNPMSGGVTLMTFVWFGQRIRMNLNNLLTIKTIYTRQSNFLHQLQLQWNPDFANLLFMWLS